MLKYESLSRARPPETGFSSIMAMSPARPPHLRCFFVRNAWLRLSSPEVRRFVSADQRDVSDESVSDGDEEFQS
ncbi:hypothetical protein [Bradyrhizobium sp. 2TAF24]|uniref:hypothetical protein n=1 Tax=Bradyrhizobium sp. 2TAF24 TaxID=3233011 RepID=UPI003F934E2B